MLRHTGGMALVALCVLISLCSCGESDRICRCGYDFPAGALTLEVPDSVDAGQPINATITGLAGCGCTYYARTESKLVGRKWILRPIGHAFDPAPGTACLLNCKHFGDTLTLIPEGGGWIYVEVQSSAPVLLDSTFVRSE